MARVGFFKRICELLDAPNIAAKRGSAPRVWKTPAASNRTAPNLEAAMIERDPNIVKSGLSRTVKKDGVTVEVSIIRLEHETEWSLEVINSAGTSVVWDDQFASDDEAFAEFERTSAEEGMRAFLDKENVIPLRR